MGFGEVARRMGWSRWTALIGCLFLALRGANGHALESVWVSTVIFSREDPSPLWEAIDLAGTANNECVGSFLSNRTLSNDKTLEVIRTAPGTWDRILVSSQSGFVNPWVSEANFGHQVRMGPGGAIHILYSLISIMSLSNGVRHGAYVSGSWAFDGVANATGVSASALAVDAQGHLHAIHDSSDRLFYWKNAGLGWQGGVILNSNRLMNELSIVTDGSDNPLIAFVTWDPFVARVWKKSGAAWTTVRDFPGPYRRIVLRVDSMDRIHAAMPVDGSEQVRYVRMSSTGVIQVDLTFPIQGQAFRCALAIDEMDGAHLLANATLINAQTGEAQSLPVPFLTAGLAMLTGGTPYAFGRVNAPLQGNWTALARLNRSAPPNLVSRSTNGLTWSWDSLPEPAQGVHLLRFADGVDLSGRMDASLTTGTVMGLGPNTPLQLSVRGLYPGFAADSDPSTVAHTLANPATPLSLSRPSHNTLGVAWASNGNPAGTRYRPRLTPPFGGPVLGETPDLNWVFGSIDPDQPYALTLAAVNGDGIESVGSSTVQVVFAENMRETTFALGGGLLVSVRIAGPPVRPEPVVAALSETVFPPAAAGLAPTGVGFRVLAAPGPTPQQSAAVSIEWPAGLLTAPAGGALILARFDLDRGEWIPLVTTAGPDRLTAPVADFGSFQVMARSAAFAPEEPLRAFPNPFRPKWGTVSVRGATPGAVLRIVDVSGHRVRELTADASGGALWDGTDAGGNPLGSGVYAIHLGESKRVRVLLKR